MLISSQQQQAEHNFASQRDQLAQVAVIASVSDGSVHLIDVLVIVHECLFVRVLVWVCYYGKERREMKQKMETKRKKCVCVVGAVSVPRR